MPNLANITLVGHLGRDPDIKVMPSGDPIAEFSVAHTFHRKSGDVTTWWRCTAFGRSAEIASQFLAKGDAVCVLGTAYNEPWTDKDGADRLTLRCMVDRIVLLGKRAEGVAPGTAADRAEAPAKPKPAAKPAQKQAAEASNTASGFADMEDDIPFVFNECSVLNGMIVLPRTITRAKRAHKTLHQLREGSAAF